MNIDDLTIPAGETARLVIPPAADWPAVVAANRSVVRDVIVGGYPLAELAARARAEAVIEAAAYTRSLGLSIPSPLNAGGPIVASGHQPYAYHPGVAVKPTMIARLAGEVRGIPLYISVDSDDFRHPNVATPTVVDGRIVIIERELFPKESAAVYEQGRAEPWGATVARLRSIVETDLADERLAIPRTTLAAYVARLEDAEPTAAATHTGRAIQLRRRWEADTTGATLELPVSHLSAHLPFRLYAADILDRLPDFAAAYNGELARYRKERKLRYPVNPFPDLAVAGGRREAPFWLLTDAGRAPLFVEGTGESATLHPGAAAPAAGTVADLLDGKIAIRPKAITLSIYLRLFVCDFFLHGVGGAKYDTVTDPIVRRYYGVAPPAYGCATLTVGIGAVAPTDPAVALAEATRRLRDIGQHPEAMGELLDDPARLAPLAAEKERLVAAIKTPDADKKTIGRRIAELNREMTDLFADVGATIEREIAALEIDGDEHRAATYRTYPFFLYPPTLRGV
jgi:hypothetical protein